VTLHKPLWMQNLTYSAAEDRQMVVALGDNGVLGATDLAVSQRGAGANMSVDIAAGRAVVNGINGPYLIRSDTAVNRTINAAPPVGNQRIDVVYAQVRDAQATGSGTDNDLVIGVQTGTHSSSPAVPAIPSYSIPLARILLTQTTTTITNALITNARVQSASPADRYWPYVDANDMGATTVNAPTAVTWGSIVIPAPNRPVKVIAHATGSYISNSGEINQVCELAIRVAYGPSFFYQPDANRGISDHALGPAAISQVVRHFSNPGVGEAITVSARINANGSAIFDRGMLVVTVFPA